MDAAARSCLDTGRIQMTITRCQTLIEHNSTDEIGAHLTLSLAYARMENEDALDALDAQFKREGNTWKIIDVNVGGVWMVQNYHSQFASVLANGGIPALIRSMNDKTSSLNQKAMK